MSKRNRREAFAYAICAAISAAVFAINGQIERLGPGAGCALLHPIDEAAQLTCRVEAVVGP